MLKNGFFVAMFVFTSSIFAADIKVVYNDYANKATTWLKAAKKEFESKYLGNHIILSKVLSAEGDYNTKTVFTLQTDDTADVVMVDSFLLANLVGGQNLSPLPVNSWADWKTQFVSNLKEGMTISGKTYSVPISTDTRGLFYNVEVFRKVGIPTPWAPKNWQQLYDTLAKLHKAGVKWPLWFNGSKAQSESTSMQTFEMLLSGTNDWLIENGKQVANSAGFRDTLGFLEKIRPFYSNSALASMLDAKAWRVLDVKMPQSRDIAVVLDGNWKGKAWIKAFPKNHADVIKVAPMPKQNDSGFTSMSGGWTLAIGALSKNKDLAFEFIKIAANKPHMLLQLNLTGNMSTRRDVANLKAYKERDFYRSKMNAFTEFTKFRPTNETYPLISAQIQAATEAVVTGKKSAIEAAKMYEEHVKKIAGPNGYIVK